MPFSPKCRYEYEIWVTVCSHRGVELVDKLEPILKHPTTTSVRKYENIVTVESFSHPEEAYLYSAKLESEGIDSYVADDHIVMNNWLYSTAVGGVKLRVFESDYVEARNIINTVRRVTHTYSSELEKCPSCGSDNIHYDTFSVRPMFIIWFITWLFLGNYYGFTVPLLSRKWRCRNCGNQWK